MACRPWAVYSQENYLTMSLLYDRTFMLNIHFNYLSDSLGGIGNVITIKKNKTKYEFSGSHKHTYTYKRQRTTT